MPCAILGYKNSILPTTKQKPTKIRHLNTHNSFNKDINRTSINNNTQQYSEKIKISHKEINQRDIQTKDRVI